MGTPSTTFLGQDGVEVATPLQHTSAHGMCNNSESQGTRPGCNGTDNWKSPRQEDDMEFEQMPRVIRNNIPIRHDDSRWSISGAVRIQSRQQSSAVQVQVSLRITVKEKLGHLVQLLARLYSHRGQTSHPAGSMANSNPQEMDMVLYQLNRQPTQNRKGESPPLPAHSEF